MDLKEARKRKGLTQEQVAELIGVSPITISRWEQGKVKPRQYQIAGISEAYGLDKNELDYQATQISLPSFFVDDPISQLAALPYASKLPCALSTITKLSEKARTMENRRDFLKGTLGSLIVLPISTIGVSNQQELLHQITVGLAACHEISRSRDAIDLQLAYNAVGTYMDILNNIAHHSSAHRNYALNLATQTTIFRSVLASHCMGNLQAIEFAKQAISLAKQIEDIPLRLSAYSKLAWYYFYDGKRTDALKTAQEAESFLIAHKQEDISPCIWGGTHSTLALMQARNRLPYEDALAKAIEKDPGDQPIAFMQFTKNDLPNELGLIYAHAGHQQKAMHFFQQSLDIKNERWRLGSVRGMALTHLKAKDRDKKEALRYLTDALQGARNFRTEWGFNEALNLYELADHIWPGDSAVDELRPLTIHWSVKKS